MSDGDSVLDAILNAQTRSLLPTEVIFERLLMSIFTKSGIDVRHQDAYRKNIEDSKIVQSLQRLAGRLPTLPAHPDGETLWNRLLEVPEE